MQECGSSWKLSTGSCRRSGPPEASVLRMDKPMTLACGAHPQSQFSDHIPDRRGEHSGLTDQSMRELTSIDQLPSCPAVYGMYGGRGRSSYVAYVGIADVLRRRIIQHLVNRDSSVATGTAAVGLNPDYVTAVRWWEHPEFGQRHVLEAAELVAFDIL